MHVKYLGTVGAIFLLLNVADAHAALIVTDKATRNISCTGYICSATAKNAMLNVTDLATLLESSPIELQSGAAAQDIMFNVPFSWTSVHDLTLDAHRSIMINKSVSDAGSAALILNTNDGGTAGDLIFSSSASITFLSLRNVLKINGEQYRLVGDIQSLASASHSNPNGLIALAHSYDASNDGTYSSPPAVLAGGTFEGLGNTISNFNLSDNKTVDGNIGLFSQLGTSDSPGAGTIRDLHLANVTLSALATYQNTGAFAGVSYGNILHVSVSGNVTSRTLGGGVVGSNAGFITQAVSSAAIIGAARAVSIGGIVGENENAGAISYCSANNFVRGDSLNETAEAGGVAGSNLGTIQNCRSTSAVSQAGDVGGLVGENRGTVVLSSASGRVSDGGHAGGLVGYNSAIIDRSFATGPVTQAAVAGGLLSENLQLVSNSYSLGKVSGSEEVGGFAGYNSEWDRISSSYSVGKSSGEKGGTVGGFLGRDSGGTGSLTSDYWDLDTGIKNPSRGAGYPLHDPGITGLTDAQLKSGLPAGFDPNVWAQNPNINSGYPYLIDNPPSK